MHDFAGRGNVIDKTRLDIRFDDLGLIVGAFVIVNVKVVNARQQVIIQLLFEIATLVFHDSDDR